MINESEIVPEQSEINAESEERKEVTKEKKIFQTLMVPVKGEVT